MTRRDMDQPPFEGYPLTNREIKKERLAIMKSLNRFKATAKSRSKIRRTMASRYQEIADDPTRFLSSMAALARKVVTAPYNKVQGRFKLSLTETELATFLAAFDSRLSENQWNRLCQIDQSLVTKGFHQIIQEDRERLNTLLGELLAARRFILTRLGLGQPAPAPAFLQWEAEDFLDYCDCEVPGDPEYSQDLEDEALAYIRKALEGDDELKQYFPSQAEILNPKNTYIRASGRTTPKDQYATPLVRPGDLPPARSSRSSNPRYDFDPSPSTSTPQEESDWSLDDLGRPMIQDAHEDDYLKPAPDEAQDSSSPPTDLTPDHPDYEYYKSDQYFDDVMEHGEARPPSKSRT